MNSLPVYTTYVGDGVTTDFTINFNMLSDNYNEVLVLIDEVPATDIGYTVTKLNANTYRITPAPVLGVDVTLLRDTETDKLKYKFYLGSIVTPQRLDYNFNQLARAVAEARGVRSYIVNKISNIGSDLRAIYTTLSSHDLRITSAQSAADTAQYTANVATSKADIAKTAADVAQGTANQAVLDAARAQSTADTTIGTANDALLITNTTVIEDVTLSDGSTAKSLGKVVSEQILGAGVGEVRTVAGYTGDVTANDLAEHPTIKESTKEDRFVITESGRTQREKNSDFITSADFGILPNTTEDQTAKFDIFFDYLRKNKVKGYVLSGNYVVSPNKNITLDGEIVNYCLDVSGLDIEGALYGYKGANGAVFTVNPLIVSDVNDVVMLQTSFSASAISPKIKGFLYKNAQNCIRLPYVVQGEFSHLYAGTDCVNGIILGDFTLSAGCLFNKFEHINMTVSGKGLDVRGKDWVNANIFENFYISGGLPSSINCLSGYGAIANKFIGGEFASKSDTGTAGIELTRTRSTTFDGTYFEAHGHAIILNSGNGDVMLNNPVFGTTKKSRGEAEYPSFIHHRGGSPNSVIVNGGSVFIGTGEDQKDMRLITTTNASNLTVFIQKNPSVVSSNTGYKVMDYTVFRNLAVFQGIYREVLPLPLSTSGGSITGLPPTSLMEVTVSNRLCNINFRLDYDANAIYGVGDYYIQLPRSTAGDNVPLGTMRVSKPSTSDYYGGFLQPLTSGNCGMRYYLHTATLGTDNAISIKTAQPLINKSFMDSLGTGGIIKGNISYYI